MAIIRPLISYYGSKWNLVKRGHYPAPIHSHIIEPFAGSAGYALQYPDRHVTLIDLDETLCGVWSYLIRTPSCEILRLPILEVGQSVDEVTWSCEEARHLAGYWLSLANSYPGKKLSPWAARKGQGWASGLLKCMAQSVRHIRHWKVICGDYADAPCGPATRFVDAPYQGSAGRKYRHSSRKIDYPKLGNWCKKQPGQLIVCEGEGADWLPFTQLTDQWGSRGHSKEMIYLQGDQGGQLSIGGMT